MALHFVLRINDNPIGSFYAQRREEKIPLSGLCTYDVKLIIHGKAQNVVVQHNRREGALALIHKALAAVDPWVRVR